MQLTFWSLMLRQGVKCQLQMLELLNYCLQLQVSYNYKLTSNKEWTWKFGCWSLNQFVCLSVISCFLSIRLSWLQTMSIRPFIIVVAVWFLSCCPQAMRQWWIELSKRLMACARKSLTFPELGDLDRHAAAAEPLNWLRAQLHQRCQGVFQWLMRSHMLFLVLLTDIFYIIYNITWHWRWYDIWFYDFM